MDKGKNGGKEVPQPHVAIFLVILFLSMWINN